MHVFAPFFFFFIKSAFQPTEAKENNSWSRLERKEIKQKKFSQRGKTQVTKSRLVDCLNLIGLESCTHFMDQSQSEVKPC